MVKNIPLNRPKPILPPAPPGPPSKEITKSQTIRIEAVRAVFYSGRPLGNNLEDVIKLCGILEKWIKSGSSEE